MRDEGAIILIIDSGPLCKAYQHRTSRPDLAGADHKPQFARAGDAASTENRPMLNDRWEGDHSFVVDGRKTKAVKAAAAWRGIATGHQFAQHACAVKIQYLQGFPTAPDRC